MLQLQEVKGYLSRLSVALRNKRQIPVIEKKTFLTGWIRHLLQHFGTGAWRGLCLYSTQPSSINSFWVFQLAHLKINHCKEWTKWKGQIWIFFSLNAETTFCLRARTLKNQNIQIQMLIKLSLTESWFLLFLLDVRETKHFTENTDASTGRSNRNTHAEHFRRLSEQL